MNGLLLLNKPEGITSFKAIDLIKKKFRLKKIGHAGTIDSFAGGLLIVGINEGTKLLHYYLDRDKAYEAVFRLGTATDTHDPNGQVVLEYEGVLPGINDIRKALSGFVGIIEQVPPAYSAVKVNGKRASDRVRNGESVNLSPKKVKIYDIEPMELKEPFITLRINCSKGTYIRSLARDLGNLLGCGATVTSLVRTSVAPFSLENAIKLEDILRDGALAGKIIPLSDALPFFPKIFINEEEREDILKGRPVPLKTAISGSNAVAVYKNKMLAVLNVEEAAEGRFIKPDRVIFDG